MPRGSKISSSIALQNKINDLHAKHMGYQAISNELNKEGYKLSHMSVKRYLDDLKEQKTELLDKDSALAGYVKERILDTGKQLQKANQFLWEMLEESKVSKSFKLSVLKEIRSTIQLADELISDYKGLKIEQGPQSKIQLIQVVVNKLQDLEKTGDIKILNPKLKNTKEVENGKDESSKENNNKRTEQHNHQE